MKRTILLLVLAAVVLTVWWTQNLSQPDSINILTTIQQSKKLRCGTVVWEPYVIRNPNTGTMSGIVPDYLNTIASQHGYHIEWAEIPISDAVIALNSNRIDWYCVPCSPNDDFRRVLDFNIPFGYLPYYLFTSTDRKPANANIPTARFAAVEGFIPFLLTHSIYPDAKLTVLPQNTSVAELFDQIKYGKADALINEGITSEGYIRNNPGVVERNPAMTPRIMPMWFPTRKNDTAMETFLSNMFSLEIPANKHLLKNLLNQYNLPTDLYCLDHDSCPGLDTHF